MWFHRPFRADRWLLYAQESPVAGGARGLARGEVFTEEGELVVSVVQEGLIRTVRQPPEISVAKVATVKKSCPVGGGLHRLSLSVGQPTLSGRRCPRVELDLWPGGARR